MVELVDPPLVPFVDPPIVPLVDPPLVELVVVAFPMVVSGGAVVAMDRYIYIYQYRNIGEENRKHLNYSPRLIRRRRRMNG